MAREAFEAVNVRGRDDRTAGQVTDRHGECIDRELRSGPHLTEQLSSTHPRACIHRAHLDAISPQSGEHGSVSSPASNHFGQHGSDRCNGELLAPHLDDQGAHTIALDRRAVR